MNRRGNLLPVFGIPALLATGSLIGLICALTGDGWRDATAWVGLAMPVLAVGWAIRRRHA